MPGLQHAYECSEADEQNGHSVQEQERVHPAESVARIIHTQTTIVNNLLREFGLTPSSRTRVATVEQKNKPINRFALLDMPYEDWPEHVRARARIRSPVFFA